MTRPSTTARLRPWPRFTPVPGRRWPFGSGLPSRRPDRSTRPAGATLFALTCLRWDDTNDPVCSNRLWTVQGPHCGRPSAVPQIGQQECWKAGYSATLRRSCNSRRNRVLVCSGQRACDLGRRQIHRSAGQERSASNAQGPSPGAVQIGSEDARSQALSAKSLQCGRRPTDCEDPAFPDPLVSSTSYVSPRGEGRGRSS